MGPVPVIHAIQVSLGYPPRTDIRKIPAECSCVPQETEPDRVVLCQDLIYLDLVNPTRSGRICVTSVNSAARQLIEAHVVVRICNTAPIIRSRVKFGYIYAYRVKPAGGNL